MLTCRYMVPGLWAVVGGASDVNDVLVSDATAAVVKMEALSSAGSFSVNLYMYMR